MSAFCSSCLALCIRAFTVHIGISNIYAISLYLYHSYDNKKAFAKFSSIFAMYSSISWHHIFDSHSLYVVWCQVYAAKNQSSIFIYFFSFLHISIKVFFIMVYNRALLFVHGVKLALYFNAFSRVSCSRSFALSLSLVRKFA